jgi:polysaccharide biosynthesis transport protein
MNKLNRPTRSGFPARETAEDTHLMDYVRILYKRRWIALPIFLIVFTVGALNALRQTPIYQARTQLLIETDSPKVARLDQMFQAESGYYDIDFYTTQYRMLQSRSLAKKTIDAMQLWNAPRLGEGPDQKSGLSITGVFWSGVDRGVALVKAPFAKPKKAAPVSVPDQDETVVQSQRIDEFQGGLEIAPVRNSRLVDVLYTSTDPVFAANAANALSKAYISQSMELKFSASKDATDWLSERLTEQRRALEASEAALQAYREQNGAVSVTDSASNIVVQRLTDLNSALTKAKTERINKEALYNQLKTAETTGAVDAFPAVLANEYIQKLRSDLADLQRQQAQLAERYGERHAEMIKIRTAIENADAKLRGEVAKVVESVKNEYLASFAEERSLQGALNSQKSEALGLNRKGIEFGVLQREVDSNRQIYESLMQRTKETGISSELRASNIRVVDPAEVPRAPISPNIRRALTLSFVASLTMAFGLVFFVEYLDNRLKTPQDLKAYLGIPFLGMIPAVPKNKDLPNPLLHMNVPANFSEAFKTVRTNVLFSTAEEGVRSLVVTSAGPGEGKSLVSANLAVALAQTGLRVLLVDADMRRPRVNEIFDIPEEPGFSNLLTGNAKASEVIRKAPVHGLWLISAGHIPPNPAELLASPRYVDFLASLDEHFDWVVVDTPPVLVVADSMIVANQATGVVFVVGADQTGRQAAKNAVEQLEATNAHVIGSILNRADIHRNPHYYSAYYRKEYSRYYETGKK